MIPVILSGGSGTRLWPVSTKDKPKQFSTFLDEPLFHKTYTRLKPLGSPWVITTKGLANHTNEALIQLNHSGETTILEPFGANTAAAIALLCKKFEDLGLTDEVVGVFPADHFIQDSNSFIEHVKLAEKYALDGHVVTLGIRPTHPATGYGYIELLESESKAIGFREKPHKELAMDFLSRGNFVWNAGMFIFKISTMIDLFKAYQPQMLLEVKSIRKDFSNIDEVYANIQKISFDVAIMEKLNEHICITCSFAWSDIGSWDSLIDYTSDFSGEKIEISSQNNSVIGKTNKSYSFVSVSDLIVVDTEEALVVMKKGQSELVKEVVDRIGRHV